MLSGVFAELQAIAAQLAHRIITAFSIIPDAVSWLYSAALLLIFALISLPVGFYLGFLNVDVLKASRAMVVRVMAIALVTTAIAEELFFRVLLLPHITEHPTPASQWLWASGSLAIFIIYHPLNAMTFYPPGRKTFINPVFLFLTALLGIVCTIAYWQSGSIWPPVVIHWLVLVVWLFLLGGYGRLHG